MNLKETIHSIAAQFGESVLDEPLRLLGLLEDLGGFDEEDPHVRKSLREQIRSGGVRQPRKLTDDQKTNIAIMIWCLLMLACLVTGVTGFWKLFAQTISYSGACWMIFPSIIVGGILWLFNEAF